MITPITLTANVFAERAENEQGEPIFGASKDTDLGWNLEIPEGFSFWLTHLELVNKYPVNPMAYDWEHYGAGLWHIATMYLVTTAWTIAAHSPVRDWIQPPYRMLAAGPFTGKISNGMQEHQFVFAMAQGYLVPSNMIWLINGFVEPSTLLPSKITPELAKAMGGELVTPKMATQLERKPDAIP